MAERDKIKERIHPHKFILWLAIGSILMMFAGLTSAYILKRNMANWQTFDLPTAFWYSTVAVALSSLTIWRAAAYFKARNMSTYRVLTFITAVLGILFVVLQIVGFSQLVSAGTPLSRTSSVDFLYVIVGLHGLHVIAGIVVLIVLLLKAFSAKTKTYTSIPLELASTYWHFVGILWAYLLIFLLFIK